MDRQEEKQILEQAEAIIDREVRPYLKSHGGDISLKEIRDNVLYFQLSGQCNGCPSAWITAEEIVKEPVLNAIPQLTDVVVDNSVDEDLLQLARDILSGRKVLE